MGMATTFALFNIIIMLVVMGISIAVMILSIRFMLLGIKALQIYIAKAQAESHNGQI